MASIHGVEGTGSTATSVTESETAKAKITLDTQISAGGSNFPNGQRHLIAMAHGLRLYVAPLLPSLPVVTATLIHRRAQ